MCWGVLGKVVSVSGLEAEVEVGGAVIKALVAMEGLNPGDVVLVHAGVVLEKVDREDVIRNLSVYYDLMKYHYVFNGIPEEEASSRAREDLVKLATELGVPADEILRSIDEGGEVLEVGGGGRPPEVPDGAFTLEYTVQLAETDYLQVMHYTNYMRVCERTFMALLREVGLSYTRLIHEYGVFIPTVEVSAKIKSPARMDNALRVYVWVEEIGRKHIKYRCVVENTATGRVSADVVHVAVCTDTAITSSHEIPEDVRVALSKYLITPPQSKEQGLRS